MMVNNIPSYCVSLDILMSEYSVGNSAPQKLGKAEPNMESNKFDRSSGRANNSRFRNVSLTKAIQEISEDKCKHGPSVSEIKRTGVTSTQRKRWLVLFIYCCISFMQALVWNTWSPIASAALYAFPSWTPGTVALFSNWGCVCFILFIFPTCWMLNEKGLRYGCIIGSSLCLIGSGVRCIPRNNEFWFTICAHIGAFINATAGVIMGPSALLMSSNWFPPDQRASATGAGTAISALGMAGSYLLGPFMISLPTPDYQLLSQREKIRGQIEKLMYFDFIIHFSIFWLVLFFFPSNPTIPPSQSTLLSFSCHRNFKKSFKKLIRNGNAWLLGFSAALSSGMTGPWLSQLTILFSHRNFSSRELARLGLWTIISSCLFSITATRFSDMFQGRIKAILLGLVTFATIMFICVFKLVNSPESTVNKNYLVQAVIAGFSASWASSPLFYELGAEIAFPVPEGIVAGYIMSMSSMACAISYAVFYMISDTGLIWLNYGLVAYNIGSIIFLFCVTEMYNRLAIDE